MFYLTRVPGPPLNQFVELLWFYDGFEAGPHKKERLMPDGSSELVINLREDQVRIYDRERMDEYKTLPGSVICGPHSSFFVIDTEEQASVLGAHFKPGGASAFCKPPLDELHNLHVSLSDLWGAEACLLRERLLAAATPEEKFDVIEACLLGRALRMGPHPAVSFALGLLRNIHTAPAITDLYDQVGLSSRQFIEVFREEVGLTPKLFSRVRRFQSVLQLVRRGDQVNWAEVAIECGYFDQAHFIHDFKGFAGINPTTYLASKTEHLNHVPVLE